MSSSAGLPDGTEDFVGAKQELEELRSLFFEFFTKTTVNLLFRLSLNFLRS